MCEKADIAALLEFLRFPSIAAEAEHRGDVMACAEWLAGQFTITGLQTCLFRTNGSPVVVGRTPHDPNKRTLLVYGHYDVQPAAGEKWTSPPFEPEIRDGRVYGRGATDDKGPFLAHVRGMAAMRQNGEVPPLNVIFLAEGEEEIGSRNLGPFLREHAEDLACDFLAVSDTDMISDTQPCLTCSTRGLVLAHIVVSGPALDVHSGMYGGLIRNPATALVALLARLHSDDGSIAIRNFYDEVKPLPPSQRIWLQLAEPIADQLLAASGSPCMWGERDFHPLERVWARPTAEILSFQSGYSGGRYQTIIPGKAEARLSFRLVPNQDAAGIVDKVQRWVEENKPVGVSTTCTVKNGGDPFAIDPDCSAVRAACEAMTQTFGRAPALVRSGVTIRALTDLRQELGRDPLLLGLSAPDANVHGADENLRLALFSAGMELHQHLLRALAAIPDE